MPLNVEAGNAVMGAASVAVNLVGAFRPKALIAWTTYNAGANPKADAYLSAGLVTETEQACVGIVSQDAAPDSKTARAYSTTKFAQVLTGLATGADYNSASRSSFDAGGFTFAVGGTPDAGSKINYLAIGGSDLVHAKIVTFDDGAAAVTGVGFRPDAILLLSSGDTAVAAGVGAALSLGWWTAGGQYAVGVCSANALVDSQTRRIVRNGRCYALLSGTTEAASGSITAVGDDGFTFSPTGGTTRKITALCLKFTSAAYVKAGHVTTGTANGQVQTASALGHTPDGVMLRGAANAFDAVVADLFTCLGAFDAARQRYASAEDVDAQATTNAKSRFGTDRSFVVSSGGAEYEYLAAPVIGAGEFSLTATKTDAVARQVPYLSFGTPPAAGGPRNLLLLGVG